jgi:hypothetical protein
LLAGFLLSLFLQPWRWIRYVLPKHRLTLNGLHGVISQKMILFNNNNNMSSQWCTNHNFEYFITIECVKIWIIYSWSSSSIANYALCFVPTQNLFWKCQFFKYFVGFLGWKIDPSQDPCPQSTTQYNISLHSARFESTIFERSKTTGNLDFFATKTSLSYIFWGQFLVTGYTEYLGAVKRILHQSGNFCMTQNEFTVPVNYVRCYETMHMENKVWEFTLWPSCREKRECELLISNQKFR